MIYSKGTVSVQGGNSAVVGGDGRWLNRVRAGMVIYINGSNKAYTIGKVQAGNVVLLTEPFAEGTLGNVPYRIVDAFSNQYSVPYPLGEDVEKATILNRSVTLMDSTIADLDTRILKVEYPDAQVLSMVITPEVTSVSITAPLTFASPEDMTATPSIGTVYIIPPGELYPLSIGSTPSIGTVFSPTEITFPVGMVMTPSIGNINFDSLTTADSNAVTADANDVTADGAPRSTIVGAGLRFANPQGLTGLWFADPREFEAPPEEGIGIRFANPQTVTGLTFGPAVEGVDLPLPVQAPTITNVSAISSSAIAIHFIDNQAIPSDSFNVVVTRTVDQATIINANTTSTPYAAYGLEASTSYQVKMSATKGSETSPFSDIYPYITPATTNFVPNIANMDFEQVSPGDQIVGTVWDGKLFTGVGTAVTNCADTKTWCETGTPQNMTNVDTTDPRSGTRCGVIYGVRKDEPRNDPPYLYHPNMGVTLGLGNKRVYKGGSYWYRFDMKLPANFDPYTGGNLKFVMNNKKEPGFVGKGAQFVSMGGGIFNNHVGGFVVSSEYQTGALYEWYEEGHSRIDPALNRFPFLNGCYIPRGEWFSYEQYVYVSDVVGEMILRVWINDKLALEDRHWKPILTAAGWVEEFKLFPYWNGARESIEVPRWSNTVADGEPNKILIDNVMVTNQDAPPPNVDADGNTFIGLDTGTAPPIIIPNPDPEPIPDPTGPFTPEIFISGVGTIGELAINGGGGFTGGVSNANLHPTFSNDVTFNGRTSSIKCPVQKFPVDVNGDPIENDKYFSWGGSIEALNLTGAGGKMWWRVMLYFPSNFIFHHGNVNYKSSVPSSTIKGLRVYEYDPAINGTNSHISSGPYFEHGGQCPTQKGMRATYTTTTGTLSADFFDRHRLDPFVAPYYDLNEIGECFETGRWIPIEYHTNFSAGQDGYMRVYQDGNLIWEDNGPNTTAGAKLQHLALFTYWNNGAPQDQHCYVGDITVCTENNPPPNTDANGDPIIGDWVAGDAPPSRPTITDFSALNSYSLLLTWHHTNPYEVDNCKIYLKLDDVLVATYTRPGLDNSYAIPSLDAATTYQAVVTVIKDGVESIDSLPAFATTDVAVVPTGEWVLPNSNRETAQMPPRFVYPRPEAHADARFRWAHSNMEYSICIGVQGGSWPFRYELINPPTGMTIGETYGTTESPNADYGVIRWSAANVPSSGTYSVTVRVTDQEGSIATTDGTNEDITFNIEVDNTKFLFLDRVSGNSGNDGSQGSPKQDIADVWTTPNKIIVFKDSATMYTMQADGNYNMNRSTNSYSWIAEQYNSTATIDFEGRGHFIPVDTDFLLYGLTTDGIGPGDGAVQNIVRGVWSRAALHRCTFQNMHSDGSVHAANIGVLLVSANTTTPREYCSFIRNTLDNNHKRFVAYCLYSANYWLSELNVIKNCIRFDGTANSRGWFYHKGTTRYTTDRANVIWDSNETMAIAVSYGGTGEEEPHTVDTAPSFNEVCWNMLRDTRVVDNSVFSSQDGPGDITVANLKGFSLYRNTIMGLWAGVHNQFPSVDTQVMRNVSVTELGKICLSGNRFTACLAEVPMNVVGNINVTLDGQTTINETTGLLTDAGARGTAGHEVTFQGTELSRELTFDAYTAGNTAISDTDLNLWDGFVQTEISDVHAFRGSKSARCYVYAANGVNTGWGGAITPGNPPYPLYEGEDLWVRMALRFPTGWNGSTDQGSGMKLFRSHGARADGTNYGWTDIYIRNNTDQQGLLYLVQEGQESRTGNPGGGWATYVPVIDPQTSNQYTYMPKDEWFTLEYHIGISKNSVNEGGTGEVHIWWNNELVYHDPDIKSLHSTGGWHDKFFLCNYWNGGAPQDQSMWVDHVQLAATGRLPFNRDASNNLFIGGEVGGGT